MDLERSKLFSRTGTSAVALPTLRRANPPGANLDGTGATVTDATSTDVGAVQAGAVQAGAVEAVARIIGGHLIFSKPRDRRATLYLFFASERERSASGVAALPGTSCVATSAS